MAKSVTLADIAAQVGVSNVAVSKALAGKPGVSDELRLKIKQVAGQMGYVANPSGKARNAETGNIGVIVPENYYGYSISFYGQMYEKVVRALYDNSYYGILELLTKEDERAGKLPRVMLDGKVDGLILMGQLDETYIEKITAQTELPVYFLDTYVPAATFDTVISDGYYGMYMMTNYLISQGHRRIGFVGSVDATSSIADRFWGYRRALRENRVHFEEAWEIPDRDPDGKTFDRIPDFPAGMDAFACNSDFTAHILIHSLEERGLLVPQDVSVVGFDNFLPLGMDDNRITSYEVDMERMAEVCVKSLIKKIRHKKYVEGIQVVTGRIVFKQSAKRKHK